MSSVLVGVHAHEQPERLLETLASLRGTVPFDLLLLPDGPDAATRAVLAGLSEVTQSGTTDAHGAPACFNRLARASSADVVVLVESGCVAGPDWLRLLLAALDADPANGLAGPSTNMAWNAQAAFPRARDVAAAAAEAAARFGGETRSLEPLHSLADFCVAVRREVIETIGAADEGYGLGPCWEMDYSIRAARAGFRAVWACGAYVHRNPFTPRRRREEAARLEASKRRYQDKFCGLRLRGRRSDYEPGCRGEACEHFAPRGSIELLLPLVEAAPTPVPRAQPDVPLVSCIMPTRNRADFALQAVRYFQRQDYPALELLVVDDGDDGLESRLPDDGRIRYLRAPTGETIGGKRNRACAAAAGSILVHWDDDDWFGAERVRRQVEPILAGEADVSALRTDVFFDLDNWAFWRCTPELHRRLFVEDVHGGTLAFRRELWGAARYPERSLAEDAWFLWRVMRRGARLARLEGAGLFVYLRHAGNAWRFECGDFLDPAGWSPADEPRLDREDRAFYVARSTAAPDAAAPLVSCVMPTADRRAFVPHAIRYFLRQDHPNRELIVVDDGRDAVRDLVPADPRIHYVRLETPIVLGAKRNRACELARGDVVVHWDDDDWSAPHRISYQLAELERTGASVVGLSEQLYVEPRMRAAWVYRYPADRRPWVAGNTLCFRRELWARHPFPEVAVGEDTRFIWSATAGSILPLADHDFLVGVIHERNASRKRTADPFWAPVVLAEVERVLGDDAPIYLGAS